MYRLNHLNQIYHKLNKKHFNTSYVSVEQKSNDKEQYNRRISIHHMYRLNFLPPLKLHIYTLNFNTSYVSVELYFFYTNPFFTLHFNTSYVSVELLRTLPTILNTLISIHHMYRLNYRYKPLPSNSL